MADISPALDPLMRSFARYLRASTRAERTVDTYLQAVRLLGEWCAANNHDPLTRDGVESYLAHEAGRVKAATVASRYRSLQQFFKWLTEEEELDADPMAKMRPPKVPEQPVAILSGDDQRAILRTCDKGKSFPERRDAAILRLFIDTGMRLSEMAGLKVTDVDLDVDKVAWVLGKGGRHRACPFGRRTVLALDRYLRIRGAQPMAGEPALWLGTASRGRMTPSGIAQVVSRRAVQAGLGHVHPHQFRHTFADNLRRSGLDDDSLMRLAGWSSRQMLSRYGASAADSRARERYQTMAPGDAL